MKTKIINDMTKETFEVHRSQTHVSKIPPLFHYHDHYELHITLAGNAVFFINDSLINLTEGTAILISPDDLHRITLQKEGVFDRFYVSINTDYLKKKSTPFTNLAHGFSSDIPIANRVLNLKIPEIQFYIDQLFKPVGKDFGDDFLQEHYLLELLFHLNQKLTEVEHVRSEKIKSPLIANIIEYILANLENDLHLNVVAKKFFISPSHLAHKFKKETYIPFHRYVLQKRLLESKKLLREYNNASIVFEKVGFTSYTSFLKTFKKEFGITPKKYCQKCAENSGN